MLTGLLKKVYAKVSLDVIKDPNEEHMPIDEQIRYVSQFPEPKDDYERSYYKYKCWKKYYFERKRPLLVVFNAGAMVLYPFMIRKLTGNDRALDNKASCKHDAVIENVPRLPNDSVIPKELVDKYDNKIEITSINYMNGALSRTGREICKELGDRYFFHFYFRLISALKIAQFDRYISEYDPKEIAFYSYEREFTGPLQTLLCEKRNVDFTSFMHGDVVYSIAFAFQRYTTFYVWGQEYIELFKDLRCKFNGIIYRPEKLKGIARALPEQECKYFATYYFSAETRECAEVIRSVFDGFKANGLRCKIRPHPRYSDMEMLEEVFRDYYIEPVKTYPLADSITDSLYIIGLNTTVLSEAYFSGKQVVIDDVSKKGEYEALKKKKYVMLSRPHVLLSELTKMNCSYDESYRFRDASLSNAVHS